MIVSTMTLFSDFDIDRRCNEKEDQLEKEIKKVLEEIKKSASDSPKGK
jgi:hypothetical protein